MMNPMPFDDWLNKWKKGMVDSFDRRSFMQAANSIAWQFFRQAASRPRLEGYGVNDAPRFRNNPFTLGVASGDPLADSVVLWTRLAPDPLNGGGMPSQAMPVKWEVATDENFRNVVQQGTELARPELAHSVHIEAKWLKPNHVYYYRFKSGNELSPVGRTKTLPAHGSNVSEMAFAFASCQQYEHGYYTAYQHMAKEDLDLVFHLGDYIYEYGPNQYLSPTGNVRPHNSPEVTTLLGYRNRYALYRSDEHLQSVHAAFPWVVTWDDHEVENNYANIIPQKGQSVAAFIYRRAAAYQAYYEHMPLRRSHIPYGAYMQLYRNFSYGNLASFNVLDTRQYRHDQANGDGSKPHTYDSLNPARTMLGAGQEQWLLGNLYHSKTHWNVLAQQVFFCQRNYGTAAFPKYSMDSWDGYWAARQRIIDFAAYIQLKNMIILTGDIHSNWASNILTNFNNPHSRIIGAEFAGTSITSGGNGADKRKDTDRILAQNPHIKFFNGNRGYVRCRVTPDNWQTDYRVVPFVTKPGADITTKASFVYEKGSDGIEEISSTIVPEGVRISDETEQDRERAHWDTGRN
ncbi:alkaline phosphatase D family protein [Bacillus sp. T33-2]|uniref:alkaline phosphatase D family protein n=1 Tax=Bacillus sp. T33-2 TaxID=2054168 RepID=UPI000C7696F3|nr:alkaline phosphatase D family protein [Bacillus sp. T33-2]PLR92836.1 alkaline phosphatase [Bacillus sp. T33-2]